MTFSSPYPSYDPTDKLGFSYETVVKRWPIIITSVIDYLHRTCHSLSLEMKEIDASDEEKQILNRKIKEGTAIIEKISKLKYEMARDHVLEPILEDGEPSVELYNDELSKLSENKKNTWFTAPWLYAECYLSVMIRLSNNTRNSSSQIPSSALLLRTNTALGISGPILRAENEDFSTLWNLNFQDLCDNE